MGNPGRFASTHEKPRFAVLDFGAAGCRGWYGRGWLRRWAAPLPCPAPDWFPASAVMIRTAQPEKPPKEKELTCGIYAEPRMVRDLLAAWLSVRGGIRVVMRSGRVTDARGTVVKQKPDLLVVAVPANLSSTLISEHTVRAHRKRIITKLGTAGTNLTHWAVVLRHGGKAAGEPS